MQGCCMWLLYVAQGVAVAICTARILLEAAPWSYPHDACTPQLHVGGAGGHAGAHAAAAAAVA